MKFFDPSKSLYLEIDASSVSLWASLLQMQEEISFRYDEILDNVVLHPVVFASKSLLSM